MNFPTIPCHELSADALLHLDGRPVPTLIYMVLLLALGDRASDVHFEPQQGAYRLSYRVDGALYDMVPPPSHLGGAISQVFRALAELDICSHRSIQVGEMRLVAGQGSAEVVVAINPTSYGEAIHLSIDANSITNDEIRRVFSEWDQKRSARKPYEPFWPWFRWVLTMLGVINARN